MRDNLPAKLLLQLLEATPGEMAAIEGILGGQALPVGQRSLAPQRPGQRRYVLRKGQGAWGLTYAGEPAVFADRAGMDFVDYLLKHPGEAIHSLALLARVQGETPVRQRSAALDDKDATKHYLREMSRLRELAMSRPLV